MHRGAAVTGMGWLTSLGSDVDLVWSQLVDGVTGTRPYTDPVAPVSPTRIAGLVDFDPAEHLPDEEVRRTSLHQQMLYAAVSLATEDMAWSDPSRVALIVGTGGGAITEVATSYAKTTPGEWSAVDRTIALRTIPNMAAGFVARQLGIHGPCLTISTACAASTDAIGIGLGLLRAGVVDVVVAAGVEAWVDWAGLGAFAKLGVLSSRPVEEAASASRPFDASRDGLVPANGSAALVLESPRHAQARSATVLAELCGYSATCDAYSPLAPAPNGRAATAAIVGALADAHISPGDIGHVNSHGTGTKVNDAVETSVLKKALGQHAWDVPITATKSMLGHSFGACGAIEAIATIQALRHQVVPPTANLEHADPDCDLDYTPKQSRHAQFEHALTVNFGLAGQNAALVFRAAS